VVLLFNLFGSYWLLSIQNLAQFSMTLNFNHNNISGTEQNIDSRKTVL